MATTGERRADVRARLVAELERCTAEGAGSALVIEGVAGFGKTTLASSLVNAAAGLGFQVAETAALELDGARPFASVARFRDATGAPLLPRDRATGSGAATGVQSLASVERLAAVEAIVDAIEARSGEPLLLVIEDVHWADPASLAAIAGIAELCASHPVVVVLTARPLPLDAAAAVMIAGLSAEIVRLEPLTADEVETALRELCGGDPTGEVRRRAERAEGNPFLLHHFVSGLLAGAQGGGDLPIRLTDSVAQELTRLGPEAAGLVRAAAVQGSVIDVAVLADATHQPVTTLAPPITVAVRAGMLYEQAGVLRFQHDLVREAVYLGMPESVRAAAHRELAAILAKRQAPAALVGSHLVLAGGDASGQSVDELVQVAAQTSLDAPDASLEFLEHASRLASDDLGVRRVIERARMEALTAMGRTEEAASAARWILDVSDPADRSEIRARLGGLAMIAGDSESAKVLLDQAIAESATDADRSPILALAALNAATIRDYGEAERLAEVAIEVGGRADEPIGQSVGLALLARMSTYENSIADGLRLGAKAFAIADTDPTGGAHQYLPGLHYGMTAFDADLLDDALAVTARCLELAGSHRIAWSRPLYGSLVAACHYRRGDLDRARAEAEASAELAETFNSRQTLLWAQSLLALIAVHAGEPAEAVTWAARAKATWESALSSLGSRHYALAQALAKEAAGDLDGAIAELDGAWDMFAAIGLSFCHPFLASDLARMARAAGRADIEEKVATDIATAAERADVAAIHATAMWVEARRVGDRSAGRRAVDQLRGTERRLEVALWLADGGDLLDDDPAVPLREALETFTDLGASGAAAEVGARLAELGQAAPSPAVSGWGSLTPSEREITSMLAAGCTNAEIAQRRGCSRRTIESHLVRIYRKLEIDGRVKLTVAAAAHFGAVAASADS